MFLMLASASHLFELLKSLRLDCLKDLLPVISRKGSPVPIPNTVVKLSEPMVVLQVRE